VPNAGQQGLTPLVTGHLNVGYLRVVICPCGRVGYGESLCHNSKENFRNISLEMVIILVHFLTKFGFHVLEGT